MYPPAPACQGHHGGVTRSFSSVQLSLSLSDCLLPAFPSLLLYLIWSPRPTLLQIAKIHALILLFDILGKRIHRCRHGRRPGTGRFVPLCYLRGCRRGLLQPDVPEYPSDKYHRSMWPSIVSQCVLDGLVSLCILLIFVAVQLQLLHRSGTGTPTRIPLPHLSDPRQEGHPLDADP